MSNAELLILANLPIFKVAIVAVMLYIVYVMLNQE
jgi:hypothetical protein